MVRSHLQSHIEDVAALMVDVESTECLPGAKGLPGAQGPDGSPGKEGWLFIEYQKRFIQELVVCFKLCKCSNCNLVIWLIEAMSI